MALANDDQFIIDVGDVISITVYNEPELNTRAKLSASGMIRVPLVGDVVVKGKTALTVSKEIEQALFDGYLVNPSVSVIVDSVRPFYVRGAVVNPSVYQYELGIDVQQAIAMSGGLKDRASSTDWFIIRKGIEEKMRVTKDTKILPGDTLEIEESLF